MKLGSIQQPSLLQDGTKRTLTMLRGHQAKPALEQAYPISTLLGSLPTTSRLVGRTGNDRHRFFKRHRQRIGILGKSVIRTFVGQIGTVTSNIRHYRFAFVKTYLMREKRTETFLILFGKTLGVDNLNATFQSHLIRIIGF